MDVFDRYFRMLRIVLPRPQRDDIINELAEEIRSQVAVKEADLDRPLTSDEQAAVLSQYGHPLLLAARYRPARHLVGPVLFPYYWLVLKVTIGLVVAGHLIAGAVLVAGGAVTLDLGRALEDLAGTVLRIVGWITLLTAVVELWLTKSRVLELWTPDPARGPLPDVDATVKRALGALPGSRRAKGRREPLSLSRFVIAVAVSAWWLLGLRFPTLFFGSGAADLEWGAAMDRLYPVLVIGQVTMLAELFARLTHPDDTRLFRVTGAVWLIAGLALIYIVVTSDHQWLVWQAAADARARADIVGRFAGREWSVIDLANYSFSIPFVVAAIGSIVGSVRVLLRTRRELTVGLLACAGFASVLAGASGSVTAAQPEAQALPGDAAIRQLLVERIDGKRQSLGIVVGIVSSAGRRVISYGRFGHDDARLVDGETLFEIGSVTKVFTALLLADMVRRGEVALSDPVSKYLPPGVTLAAPDGRSITLEDLATHTAGLPFWPSSIPATGEGLRSLARYRDDQLYEFLRTFEVPAEAGTRWAYANTDAGLLGLALARRAHSSYEALLADRVTGPLNMKSTSVTLAPAMRARLSAGHDKQLAVAPPWDVPALAAAGSLHSTANDLLTFLSAAMGQVSSPLSPAMAAMLATRRAAPAFQQALGWWIFAEGNDQLITHVGGTLGFASQVSYQPRTQTGIVVLSNSVNAVSDITRQLLRPASGTAAVSVAAATVR